MSGYAQINGRIDIPPEEKAILDGFYYEHISLWFDTRIFIITFYKHYI
ncbi:MAG: sugar transferase [Bacilli bacterium]|nr:sugar transferase [Bacilli bacterium]